MARIDFEPPTTGVEHQDAAKPVLMSIVFIFGVLALGSIGGGVYAIYRNAIASTQFSLLGAKVSTGSVGVAFVAIGLVTAFYTMKLVLKNQYDLAALPSNRAKNGRQQRK